MSAPRRLILNGRFLGRSITGVERLALELSRAMRDLLATVGRDDIEIVAPPGTCVEPAIGELGSPRPMVRTMGRFSGHAWEQTALPGLDRRSWLLSLCNTGPIARRRQALVICDAQFVLHPESYGRAFRWWYRVLITLASRRANAVFTISHFSKETLERYRLVPRGKLHVLRLGVDHLAATEPDATVLARHGLTSRPYLLAIGSLARHKNLAMLLDAFTAADLPAVDLVIAGGSNPRVFQDAGLREAANIRYTGRVSDGELKALYANALAFMCPSLSEGFGFTPLEAMTMGCPVVATTGGAVPEMCGDAALYVDPQDEAGWRDALCRIATEPALRADLSRRASARAAGYRWRETARQMLTVLARHDGDTALIAALDNAAQDQSADADGSRRC